MLFLNLSPSDMSEYVRAGQNRVIYMGTSITDEMAAALIHLGKSVGKSNITVVLDYNEQIFRLGYGVVEAVTMLEQADIAVRKQAGLRLSVLIVDSKGWVLSLPPMAVEPETVCERANAMRLLSAQIREIEQAVLVSTSDDPDEPVYEIGNATVTDVETKQVQAALQNNPPAAFDLQRQVSVYKAHIQFVEIELEGGRIEQHTIKLPKRLKKAAFAQDEALQARLRASYKLMDSEELEFLNDIRQKVDELRDYTPSLGKRLGRVMLCTNRAEFNGLVEKLQSNLEVQRKGAEKELDRRITDSLQSLARAFVQNVMKTPPSDLKGSCSEITQEIALDYLMVNLRREAPNAQKLLQGLRLHCTYKDVTIEMLRDKEFQKRVTEVFPHEDWHKPFHEYGAAKEAASINDDTYQNINGQQGLF